MLPCQEDDAGGKEYFPESCLDGKKKCINFIRRCSKPLPGAVLLTSSSPCPTSQPPPSAPPCLPKPPLLLFLPPPTLPRSPGPSPGPPPQMQSPCCNFWGNCFISGADIFVSRCSCTDSLPLCIVRGFQRERLCPEQGLIRASCLPFI